MGSGECRFFNVLMQRGNVLMAKKDALESFILSSDNLTSESDNLNVKRKGFLQRFLR